MLEKSKFVCEPCQRKFKSESALAMHHKAVHHSGSTQRGVMPPLTVKGYSTSKMKDGLMSYNDTPPPKRSLLWALLPWAVTIVGAIVFLRITWPYIAAWLDANGHAL